MVGVDVYCEFSDRRCGFASLEQKTTFSFIDNFEEGYSGYFQDARTFFLEINKQVNTAGA